MLERLLREQSRAFVLIAIAVALAGVVAAMSLPIGLFPQVSFPRVVVDLDAGSRPADQTALTVTRPVEEAIRAIPGVQDVRSATSRGSAQISIDFGWGRDMIASTLLVDSAVARTIPSLPPGTQYTVRRMDPTVFPIISYALVSSSADPVALQDIAKYQITPLLSSVTGLARVGVQGGDTAEVQVLADPHRLADRNLSMTDLATAIKNGNVLSAVGQVQDRGRLSLVIADRSVASAAQIGEIVVNADPQGVVRVRDVATVQEGAVPVWQRIVEDGKPAVLFNIYEQPDGNAVQIAKAVEQKLAGLTAASRRQTGLLVRSECSRHPVGRKRARCRADRPRARRARVVVVPAQLARDVGRGHRRAGNAGGDRAGAQHAGHELQHHDARRDRGSGRAADR